MSEETKPVSMGQTAFHIKYRPRTLERIIGNEKIVQRLEGIVRTTKVPNALLFVGPSSAGKTTLARAFVANLFGVKTLDGQTDFHEVNAADSRGIDDIRQLVQQSKLKPRTAIKRVILIDEAQQLSGPAAQVLLKPIEQPPPSTVFIFGSMEPEKMHNAIRNRCSQFLVEPPTKESVLKYLNRILRREKISYVTEAAVEKIANNSNGEFRTAANLLEAVVQYAEGSGKKKLSENDIDEALSTTESLDDQIAVRILVAIYANKFKQAHRATLDIQDPFKMIGALLRLNSFLLNQLVLGVEKHKNVWWSQQNRELKDGVSKLAKIDPANYLMAFAVVQEKLVQLRSNSGAFMVGESVLISSGIWSAVEALTVRNLYITKAKD